MRARHSRKISSGGLSNRVRGTQGIKPTSPAASRSSAGISHSLTILQETRQSVQPCRLRWVTALRGLDISLRMEEKNHDLGEDVAVEIHAAPMSSTTCWAIRASG